MRKNGQNFNYVFDVVFKNAPRRPRRSVRSYQRFLRGVVPGSSPKLDVGSPRKLLLADKVRLLAELQRVVSRRSARPNVILFELSGADYHDFDDFTAALLAVMKGRGKHFPKWIVFVISRGDSEDVRKSVVTQKLVSLLAKHNVGLLVHIQEGKDEGFVLSGSWPSGTPLPHLESPVTAELEKGNETNPLTKDEILSGCQILYGHFSPFMRPSSHVPALLSLNRLAKDTRFQAALRATIRDLEMPTAPVIIAPLLEATGIEVAAYALDRTLLLLISA